MKLPKWVWILLSILIGLPVLFFVFAVLTGLLFPASSGALRITVRTQAEATAFNLKNAIAAFHTEYRDYPLLDPANDLTADSDHTLMDILLGSDEQAEKGGRNPRRIAFYSDKRARPMGEGRF